MAGKKEIKLVPTEEQPYEIPENWCWVRMRDLYVINPKNSASDDLPASFVPMERIAPGMVSDFTYEVQPWGKAKKGHTQFADGDVAFAKISPCFENRKSMMVNGLENGIGAGTTELIILRQPLVDQAYTFWMVTDDRFIQGGNQTYSGTVGQQRISMDYVREYPVPLAPLAEQKRIVDTIVDLFADLDKAAENAQTIIDGYEVRKNAILYQAFNGDLTEEWRKASGVSEQWVDCVLLDVLKEKPRNGYSPQPVNYPTKYKSMTLSATTSGTFAPEHFKYIDEEIPESSHLWMVPGDILIQRANSLEKVGTSAIYTGGYHEFIYPDLMMKLQVKDGVLAEFIAYQLKTQTVLSYFRSNATGTAGNMPKINQQVVSSAPMRIPTLAEQQEIVRILDELLGNEQRIKVVAEEMLDKIAMMKKSILADAFRGKLGTNDPADEPATELLRQILA